MESKIKFETNLPDGRNQVQPSANGPYADDMALNAAQLAAVTHDQGPLLVIAGAGTGKTRTLTHRVVRLVENGVSPQGILLLSFTRKASHEMLERAERLLDARCQQVAGGTFHAFAHTIIRRHLSEVGFDEGFSIIDRSDSEDLIGLISKEILAKADERQLPRKATLATLFSRTINRGQSLEEIIDEDYPHILHMLELIIQIQALYQQRKRELCFCDYDDLLVHLHRLLKTHESIRRALSMRYQYILVDEYQDTNRIQAEIISLLTGPEQNVMVVGDDAQSIYAFRGANFKNIISFPDHFPGARVIKLEENYRSRQPILDLTNDIIAAASERYSKKLFTRRQGGRKPKLVATTSENAQSRYIVKQIRRRVADGVSLEKMAVLFRAGFHSFDLELELSRSAIPFAKFGGFKFAEAAHIKDMLAHIKILCTPRDRLSWRRVLMLVENIGPKTAQRIFQSVVHQGRGAIGLLHTPIKMKTNIAFNRLKELMADIGNRSLSIPQTGDLIIEYYLPILEARYDDHPRRLRDLQQLLSIMERYADLNDFLADMALEPPDTSIEGRLSGSDEAIQRLNLSTIHSAKGLEWHTVFVIWALDGRFPSRLTIDRPDALEEERRLMYVAATRAREDLFITYPTQIYDRTSQSILYRPSRFVEDTPESMLKKIWYNPQA